MISKHIDKDNYNVNLIAFKFTTRPKFELQNKGVKTIAPKSLYIRVSVPYIQFDYNLF